MTKFEKNISVLSDEYVEKIKKSEKPIWMKHEKSLNGDDNFSVYVAGVENFAYDKQAAKRTAKDILKDFHLDKGDVCVLVGFGIGNTASMLLEKSHPESKVICFEPIWYLLKQGLCRFSFLNALSTGRLILCNNASELSNSINYVDNSSIVDRWFIIKEPYTQYVFNHYLDGYSKVESLVNMIQCNVGTVQSSGKQIALNDIKNIPRMIQEPGIICLKNKYKKSAAIVVSTGPSLRKNIHILLEKKTRERCIIVCVAQALRTLLGYGIRPDYACTVDFGEVNESHFTGLENCGVPLVALNRAYADIFDSWSGDLYVAGNGEIKNGTLSDVWVDKGHVMQGGSVSHFALSLASHFGCKKIALVGQDLSYDESMLSHVSGTDSAGRISVSADGELIWDVNDGHGCISGTRQGLGLAWYAQGYWGGEVLTNAGLQSFSTAFTSIANIIKSKVYNCTEGGINIKGIRRMMLKEFVNTVCANMSSDAVYQKIILQYASTESALVLCRNDIKSFERLIDLCERGIDAAEKMKKEIDIDELRKLMRLNHETSTEAHKIASKNQVLTISIFKASRDVAGKMNTTCKGIETDREKLMKRIERNQYILREARLAASELLPVYRKVLRELETIDAGGLINRKEPKRITEEEFERQARSNNWQFILSTSTHKLGDRFVLEAERRRDEEICSSRNKYEAEYEEKVKLLKVVQCIESAREIGQLSKKWKCALRYLKIAENIAPNDSSVLYGIASCLFMLSKFKESLTYYEAVLRDESVSNRQQIQDEMNLLKSVMENEDA